jgi:hypothetical protein
VHPRSTMVRPSISTAAGVKMFDFDLHSNCKGISYQGFRVQMVVTNKQGRQKVGISNGRCQCVLALVYWMCRLYFVTV